MPPVYVRKEGAVCTVYLEGETPIPFHDFEQPPMGFPFTASEGQIRAKFGNDLVFVQEKRAPQPEAGTVLNVFNNNMAGGLVEQDNSKQIAAELTQQSKALPPSPSPVSVTAPPAALSIVESLTNRVLGEFRALAAAYHKEPGEVGKQELEAVGSFLLNCFPELEATLVEMSAPPAAPAKRRLVIK